MRNTLFVFQNRSIVGMTQYLGNFFFLDYTGTIFNSGNVNIQISTNIETQNIFVYENHFYFTGNNILYQLIPTNSNLQGRNNFIKKNIFDDVIIDSHLSSNGKFFSIHLLNGNLYLYNIKNDEIKLIRPPCLMIKEISMEPRNIIF